MSEGLERLKGIGAQKIYEETHIPIEHVQAIIHESFDSFSKVQFLGFVSILEREYHEDLSELKAHGLQNFETINISDENLGVFIVPQKKKSFTFVYILLALIIFAMVAYFKFNSSQEATQASALDNSQIQIAQEVIGPVETNETLLMASDINQSLSENNVTLEAPIVVEVPIVKSLKFTTQKKLWLGYIDVATNKHYNKIFTGEFTLDPEKDWLFVLGHGYVDILVNDELIDFHSKDKIRFLYKDGEIKSITLREFKKLNRGNKW